MQKQNIYYAVVLAASMIFLPACEVIENNNNQKTMLVDPITTEGGPACYLNNCFETTSMNSIQDPHGDFVYPDPKNFNNENLRPQYIQPFSILDLQNLNPKQKLAPNFNLGDFMSLSKGRYGLISSNVISIIQFIRNEVNRPVYVTSGYRSPGYNRNTDGAAAWSRHTYGDALDFSIEGLKISQLPEFCQKHGASFTLTYEFHVHCDWRKASLEPAYYQAPGAKLKTSNVQISTAKLIADQSRITYKVLNDQIELLAQIPLGEDEEGEPTHEWAVTLPTGEVITAQSPTLIVPKMIGDFHVQVTIGGSIYLEDVLTW